MKEHRITVNKREIVKWMGHLDVSYSYLGHYWVSEGDTVEYHIGGKLIMTVKFEVKSFIDFDKGSFVITPYLEEEI